VLNRLPKQFVVKTIAWAVAAMLALNPAASFANGGSAVANKSCSARSVRANDPAVQGASCCSRRKEKASVSSSSRASEKPAARRCCSSNEERAVPTPRGCDCGLSCSCKPDRGLPPPAFPPNNGNTGSDQLANLLAVASSHVVEVFDPLAGMSRRQAGWTAPSTSLERCIGLSRFRL